MTADEKTCVGLDTETQDGRAILIATPGAYVCPGSWRECMAFLFEHGPDFILFNMNYDMRALCAWLPRTVLRELDVSGMANHRDYRIRWKSKKSASITHRGRTVHLWDLFPFFESSLDGAAEKYLDAHKLAIPKSWLPEMAKHLNNGHRAKVIRYCKRDARLTEQLWFVLHRQCQELGVSAYRAASPASVARRAFKEVFDSLRSCSDSNRVFKRSYFGGRTEILRRGHLRRVYAYDLHSAYPGVAAKLLHPASCSFLRWDGLRRPARRDVAYGNYHLVLHVPPDGPVPPVPYRATTRLIYPSGIFECDVDVGMFRFLCKAGYDFKLVWAWEYIVETPKLLFPSLNSWYVARQTNPAVKLAAKKVLNSLYGKCAEQIHIKGVSNDRWIRHGMVYHRGNWFRNIDVDARHTCFAVAGAIAGGTRLAVLEAMRQSPRSIVAVHTDGILSTKPLDLDFGDAMGTWGKEGRWDDVFIIGTGTGVFRKGRKLKAKMRGIHATSRDLKRALSSRESVVTIPVNHAVTLADTRASGYRGLNEMLKVDRNVDANMDRKRVWPRPWNSFREMASASQRSESIVVVEKRALKLWKEAR